MNIPAMPKYNECGNNDANFKLAIEAWKEVVKVVVRRQLTIHGDTCGCDYCFAEEE